MTTLLCFFGLHQWTWTLNEGESISLSGSPPARAKCEGCGKLYGNQEEGL